MAKKKVSAPSHRPLLLLAATAPRQLGPFGRSGVDDFNLEALGVNSYVVCCIAFPGCKDVSLGSDSRAGGDLALTSACPELGPQQADHCYQFLFQHLPRPSCRWRLLIYGYSNLLPHKHFHSLTVA